MAASLSGCHVCGASMADEDLHRRWHGLGEDEWAEQKKAAGAEAVATVKEAMAKAETAVPGAVKAEAAAPETAKADTTKTSSTAGTATA